MKWRLLELRTYDGFMNMAIDEAILKSVENNQSDPTIRFYKWKPGCISLGYRQLITDINLKNCDHHNINVVRRLTGGRAVFHQETDLTYSIIIPEKLLPLEHQFKIKKSHEFLCNFLVKALKKLDINSIIYNVNDIKVNNKKVSGSVQNPIPIEGRKVILQHGTFLIDYDENFTKELINDFDVNSTISIKDIKNIDEKQIYYALKEAFLEDKNFYVGDLSTQELELANYFRENKYTNNDWLINSGSVSKGNCYK